MPESAPNLIWQLCTPHADETRGQLLDARKWPLRCILIICFAGAVYGSTMGLLSGPKQMAYAAIKLPLVLLITTAGNALINGMLAHLIGVPLQFRQSTRCLLSAYALFTLILAAVAPLALFLYWNLPGFENTAEHMADPIRRGIAFDSHNRLLLFHVTVIALAGIAAHIRLLGLLKTLGAPLQAAKRLLASWLAINLFLGCQISYILRPFFVSPEYTVEFLRPDALDGNFYESMGRAFTILFL